MSYAPKRIGKPFEEGREGRIREMEETLARLDQRVTADSSAPRSTAGEGVTSLPPGAGNGGGGGATSLLGDVTGPAGSNTVEALQNQAMSPGTAANELLKYTGTGWVPEIVDLAGDVTGDYNANTVVKIRNKDLAAPTAAEDEKAVAYDAGTDDYVYRFITGHTLLGAWTHASAATLTGVDAEIVNAFAADTALANVMPVAGFLTAIAVKLSGDVGGAGQDVIVTCYKNGIATLLTVTITGAGAVEDEATAAVTPIAFAVGDDISCFAKANGTPAAVRVAAQIYGRFSGA